MQRGKGELVLSMLLVAGLVGIDGPGATMAQERLFLADQRPAYEGEPAGINLPEGLTAIRSRAVSLNPRLMAETEVAVGERIVLNLFTDASYLAVVDRVNRNINGTVTVRARIDGFPFGYMLLSTHLGRSIGAIRIPERGEHYKVIAAPAGFDHHLMHIGGIVLVEDGPPLIPPPPTSDEVREIQDLHSRLSEKSLGPEDWAVIDVMIVYTPAASGWATANGSGIDNVMALAMERAQLALDNSETSMQVNLVFCSEVEYLESDGGHDSMTDIYRLTFSEGHELDPDGYMDEVHDWREEYGADLVAIFTLAHDTGGLGWLLNNIDGRPAFGFSLTRVQQASWTYTHIHEMGHNMGCHHHKEQNVQPGPTIWENWPGNTWSAGWRWTGDDSNHYCSLMTYSSGQYFADGITHTAVAHFSNPGVQHQGQPAGHAEDGDNARTLRGVKHVVAAYRASPPGTITITTTPVDAPWTIVGPGLDGHGNGAMVFENQTAGLYTLTWLPFEGWATPDPAQVHGHLEPGGSLTFTGVYVPSEDLVVSNIQVEQRPFTALFDVTYDLLSVGDLPVKVCLLLSTDGGATFPDTCWAVAGDVGSDVMPGISRHIVWDAGVDFPGLVSATCRLRVLAEDHEGEPASSDGFTHILPDTLMMNSPPGETRQGGSVLR